MPSNKPILTCTSDDLDVRSSSIDGQAEAAAGYKHLWGSGNEQEVLKNNCACMEGATVTNNAITDSVFEDIAAAKPLCCRERDFKGRK